MLREDEAQTRLPEDGVPPHLQCCAQAVEGSEQAPARLVGPASGAPEVSQNDEAGDCSEAHSTDEENADTSGAAAQRTEGIAVETIAEATIAADPVHDAAPVRAFQAMQANIDKLQTQVAQILKNESTATVEGRDGALQSVLDEGGRH